MGSGERKSDRVRLKLEIKVEVLFGLSLNQAFNISCSKLILDTVHKVSMWTVGRSLDSIVSVRKATGELMTMMMEE